MNQTEQYIQRILEQLQSPPREREEIREEMRIHLWEAKEYYRSEGFTENQAEKQALDDFGRPDKVGREIQESMYPYSESCCMGLALR